MSELKHQLMLNKDRSWVPCYLKSEADKAIADLEESHKKEVEQLLMEIVELKGQVNGFKNRSNLWHYNAVEEHKKFVQADLRITELKKACNDKDEWCLHTLKENRHQKFKRCLAMAKWCMTEYLHSKCLDFTNTEQWYWRRWHIRWRNLAKKFKEVEK